MHLFEEKARFQHATHRPGILRNVNRDGPRLVHPTLLKPVRRAIQVKKKKGLTASLKKVPQLQRRPRPGRAAGVVPTPDGASRWRACVVHLALPVWRSRRIAVYTGSHRLLESVPSGRGTLLHLHVHRRRAPVDHVIRAAYVQHDDALDFSPRLSRCPRGRRTTRLARLARRCCSRESRPRWRHSRKSCPFICAWPPAL